MVPKVIFFGYYIMRQDVADAEWRRWKRESPGSLDFLRSCVRQYCDSKLREDPCWVPNKGSQLPRFLRDLDIDDEYIKIKPHCFVTVRMPRDQSIEAVYAQVKGLKYTWLQGTEAVLEGFGTTNPHVHFLLPSKRHKGNLIKQLANRFKVKKHLVDYKSSDCPDIFTKRYNYIRGIKQGSKADGVAADVELRNAHNIPHLITF